MTQRSRYEDELVSDFCRRVWPVIDVEARLRRAARVADRARAAKHHAYDDRPAA